MRCGSLAPTTEGTPSSIFLAGTALPYSSTFTTSRYWDCYFNPSASIAGKRCYLHVKNAQISYPGSTLRVMDDQIWTISMDLAQPYGQAYIDTANDSSKVTPVSTVVAMLGSYYPIQEQPTTVVNIQWAYR